MKSPIDRTNDAGIEGKVRQKLPRYNHSVPQFLLNRFARKGQLWIFDKHTQKEFKLPPHRAMVERDSNNVATADIIISFENRFTFLENKAAPVIEKIVASRSLQNLTPMELATLHTFVVLQHLRSKSWRVNQDSVTNEIKKRWPEVKTNPHPDLIEESALAKLSWLKSAFDNLGEYSAILSSKHCFLMVKDCADDTYISDTPVVMHNHREFRRYGNIGLAVPGIEIYCPLSPDVTLAYFCRTLLAEMEKVHEEAHGKISSFFGTKFLSRNGLSKKDLEALTGAKAEVARAKMYYRLIQNERIVSADSANILFLNSLQVAWSYRHLAASKREFAFARKALSERPHWTQGRRITVS
jgi:hypothetical protein